MNSWLLSGTSINASSTFVHNGMFQADDIRSDETIYMVFIITENRMEYNDFRNLCFV